MNVKEFGAWHSKNVGKGGSRPSLDPFNKAKKGNERNETAKEYASQGMEEYHSYPATKDLRHERDDEKSQSQQSKQNNRNGSKQAGRSPAQFARNIVSRFVAVAASSVLIVTGYQAIAENNAAKIAAKWQLAPVTEIVSGMTWAPGETEKTCTVALLDAKGNTVKELPAVVGAERVEATCLATGLITYTVTAEDGERTYSATGEEILPLAAHAFDEGKEVTDPESGETKIVYECAFCHEQFSISTTVEEEEETDEDAPQDETAWKLASMTEILGGIEWASGETEKTCTVDLLDAKGNKVKEIPAVVTAERVEATCLATGLVTYTVTAEDGDKTYSATDTEVLPIAAHALGDGEEVTDPESGETKTVYECAYCHEQFSISTSVEEE